MHSQLFVTASTLTSPYTQFSLLHLTGTIENMQHVLPLVHSSASTTGRDRRKRAAVDLLDANESTWAFVAVDRVGCRTNSQVKALARRRPLRKLLRTDCGRGPTCAVRSEREQMLAVRGDAQRPYGAPPGPSPVRRWFKPPRPSGATQCGGARSRGRCRRPTAAGAPLVGRVPRTRWQLVRPRHVV